MQAWAAASLLRKPLESSRGQLELQLRSGLDGESQTEECAQRVCSESGLGKTGLRGLVLFYNLGKWSILINSW